MPSCAATADRLPLQVSKAFCIIFRSISSRVAASVPASLPVREVSVRLGNWNSSVGSSLPSQIKTAFSIACYSSGIFTYQGCVLNLVQAAPESRNNALSYCLQKRVIKRSARGRMSSGRSRKGGISRWIVLMR